MSEDGAPEPDRRGEAPHPRHAVTLHGHAAAERTVRDAFASGRMHHGWLVTGPEGIGKATLAWRMARFLLAQPAEAEADGLFGAPPPPPSLDVAADHPVARRVAALSEPRLHLLRRTPDPKTGRMRSEITVDSTRKLKEFFALSAAEGGRRVVIVDTADEMNRSAANAILKLLEEPPDRATLILVSHRPGHLLPTIRSRCRLLRLAPLSPEPLARALAQAGIEVEAEAAESLAALAGGAPGAAIDLLAGDGLAFYTQLVALCSRAPGIDRPGATALAQAPGKDGFPLALHLIETFLARLAVTGVSGPPAPEAVVGEAATLARLAPDASAARRWADLAQTAGARARQGFAVNLDPAALLLDMLLAIDGAARAPAPA